MESDSEPPRKITLACVRVKFPPSFDLSRDTTRSPGKSPFLGLEVFDSGCAELRRRSVVVSAAMCVIVTGSLNLWMYQSGHSLLSVVPLLYFEL